LLKKNNQLYPPFGDKIKNNQDPMISLEDDTTKMAKLNDFIVIHPLKKKEVEHEMVDLSIPIAKTAK
jgi:hypothetical protein